MIRVGTLADLDQITVVRTSVRENHLSVEQLAAVGITQESIGVQMTSGELGCWVADVHGKVVGFSMAKRDTANIFALFMLAENEKQGHGGALLAKCEKWLHDLGHKEANLSTGENTSALQFYKRRGWVLTDEKTGFVSEDRVMKKKL